MYKHIYRPYLAEGNKLQRTFKHHRRQELHLFTETTQDHYSVLSVPHNATRSQIKSSFYKLSKVYHPDVTTDPNAKDKFQKVNEAYATLGDERKRRAYDRALRDGFGQHRTAAPASAYPDYADRRTYEARRRPGATHAWDYARPGPRFGQQPGYGPYWHGNPRSSPFTHPRAGAEHHQGPFDSSHTRRATGHDTMRHHHGPTEADRMNRVSSFWRAVQVAGVVLFVATIGGGFRASA